MSVASSRSRDSCFSEHPAQLDFSTEEDMWQPRKTLVVLNPDPPVAEIQLERRESVSTENTVSTLAHDYQVEDMDLKTPRVTARAVSSSNSSVDMPGFPSNASAGPMEQLLQTLLQKVSIMEQNHPTIMAEDYAALQHRVSQLEAEKKIRDEKYESLLELRNGDLENLIKTRDLLASERREHDATKKLREDDLSNVYTLRDKLANTAWSLAKLQESSKSRASFSVRQSVGAGSDLWQAAKTAAMEQRVLELEKANKELREKTTRGGSGPTTDLAERMERMFEDSLRHREKMGAKMQLLRDEKEVLQRDLAASEDKNEELQAIIERLQRRAGI